MHQNKVINENKKFKIRKNINTNLKLATAQNGGTGNVCIDFVQTEEQQSKTRRKSRIFFRNPQHQFSDGSLY